MTTQTLTAELTTWAQRSPRVARMMAALACAVLLGVAASVQIPLPWTPVPVTLQTFVLFAAAALLTRHYAIQMTAWYLVLGIVGLPFFAGGAAGFGVLVGATGGYLFGFVAAAGWIGYLQRYVTGYWSQCMLFLSASCILFTVGATWLAMSLGLGVEQALMAGVVPFLPGDVVKVAVAAMVVQRFTRS
jgi:biotin transport system substrate-specific component